MRLGLCCKPEEADAALAAGYDARASLERKRDAIPDPAPLLDVE